MNLGFDFDKIFINYPPFVPQWLIEKIYKKNEGLNLSYRIPGRFEQKIRQLFHTQFLRSPIKENILALKDIAKTNEHQLFLVSSRFSFLRKQTETIAKAYGLSVLFKEMHFNFENIQPHEFKNKMIKLKKIKRYIDDDLPLLKFLAENNPDVIFFWLNSKIEGKIKNNLFSVKEIKEIIKNI